MCVTLDRKKDGFAEVRNTLVDEDVRVHNGDRISSGCTCSRLEQRRNTNGQRDGRIFEQRRQEE